MPVKVTNVRVPISEGALDGQLAIAPRSPAVVIFSHRTANGRFSRRNQFVAGELNRRGFSTLLLDLLTPAEEREDLETVQCRFNVDLLAARIISAIDWIKNHRDTAGRPIGLFGKNTGAAAAIIAAVKRPDDVSAVVSRAGRPELAAPVLAELKVPTLLIVGEHDPLIETNRQAIDIIPCERELAIVPGATGSYEEPGALEHVADLAAEWFDTHVREAVAAMGGSR